RPGGRRTGRRRAGRGGRVSEDRFTSSRIEAQSELGTLATLRRGLELSPQLRRGLGWTVVLAVVATLGRGLIPFVGQQTTDNGMLADGGPDAGFVFRAILAAGAVVAFTSLAQYLVNVRLFTAAESGLATLRLRAFRHIHDLSVLTQ